MTVTDTPPITTTTHRTTFAVPADTNAPALTRHITARYLHGDPRTDNAVLILSELVTNSVLHSCSRGRGSVEIIIELADYGQTLRLTVIDAGPAPRIRRARGENGGLGYAIIHKTASRHGATVTGDRGVYWAELTTPAP